MIRGNGHLPAGRAARGGASGPGGGSDTAGERHVHGAGGGGGRGGGPRRGRHYGSHYQQQHYNGHGPNNNHNHNQHHSNQFSQYPQHTQSAQFNPYQQAQMFQGGYMGGYGGSPYGFSPVQGPYGPNGAIPAAFVPYQPGYGRPAGAVPVPFAPMIPPNVIPQIGQSGPPPHIPVPLQQPAQHPGVLPPAFQPSGPPPPMPQSPFSYPPPPQMSGPPPPMPPQSPFSYPPPLPLSSMPAGTSPTTDSNSTNGAADAANTSASDLATSDSSATSARKEPSEDAEKPEAVVPRPSTPKAIAQEPLPNPPGEPNFRLVFGDMPPVDVERIRPTPPSLPWLSLPGIQFPEKTKTQRRKRWMDDTQVVELPPNIQEASAARVAAAVATTDPNPPETLKTDDMSAEATAAPLYDQSDVSLVSTKTPNDITARTAIATVPVVPAVPICATTGRAEPVGDVSATAVFAIEQTKPTPESTPTEQAGPEDIVTAAPAPAPVPVRPALWTGLFSKSASSSAKAASNGTATTSTSSPAVNGTSGPRSVVKVSNSLAEALMTFRVCNTAKVAFIEPRGLINTGNMCYMNSVLQALTYCIPFYDFLDHVGSKLAYSFKSETPMVDAMISFLREFKVIDRADPIDLQRRLKTDDLGRYGDAFIPEFVYDAINKLSRFASMRRGHQEDAEEFLGFLLECLNEECTKVMQDATSATPSTATQPTPAASVTSEVPNLNEGGGWLEVGPRQRAVVTRSSGHTSISPVNSIFGGQLRSELRVPGLKDSVTLEPYQSLQLHIDSPEVRNIVDALRGLTKPETLQGNFNSPHGKNINATKQLFIENLPPVLILHLKRFQFDSQGGTVKVWKKIGYPLELEIPREIFTRRRRNVMLSEAAPKYRLNAVIYHHGKHASGGHYTVDVLRGDGREWIRLDDTMIHRIRSEEVAEAGEEEDGSLTPSRASAAAGAVNGNGVASSLITDGTNRFSSVGEDESDDNEAGWRQVNSPVNGGSKKWSAVANGTMSPTPTAPSTGGKVKQIKDSIKDSKVAYLLFYQRIN